MLNRAYQEAIQEKIQQIDKLLEDTYRREVSTWSSKNSRLNHHNVIFFHFKQQILIEKASSKPGEKKHASGADAELGKVRDSFFKYKFGSVSRSHLTIVYSNL